MDDAYVDMMELMVVVMIMVPLLHFDALTIVTGELSIFASRQLEEALSLLLDVFIILM